MIGTRRGIGGAPVDFLDGFDALLARWESAAGTLAVSGGALRAATLGDWLNNLVTNGSMETGDPPTGWGSGLDGILSSAADERTGGAGAASIDVERGGVSSYPSARQTIFGSALRAGVTFRFGGWAKLVTSNINAYLELIGFVATTSTTWAELSNTGVGTGAAATLSLVARGSSVGQSSRFDDVFVYAQTAPALLSGWRYADFTLTLRHISPAALVTPFGVVCRYTDALNYWEIRILPNTAGNDLQIVQVTAGAETVRAEADVDWTSGGADLLEVSARGTTISTRYCKHLGLWLDGPSYASATQGWDEPALGLMLYETGVSRVDQVELRTAR